MRAHASIFSANKYFQIKVLNPYRVFVDRYERDSVVVGIVGMCIHLIAHGSEGVQITHAHSIMGTANDKSYDATHDTTHDNLEDDTHQGIHQVSHHDSTPSAVILRLMLFRFSSQL